MKIVIIGGGAAGFFAALRAKEQCPNARVLILERTAQLLSKVKISGGGRCNVTHHCFDPKLLVQNYPRGNKELLGLFHQFQPRDTINWFQQRGVELYAESDGRMFPITNNSETIIKCFLDQAKQLGVEIKTQSKVVAIDKENSRYKITLASSAEVQADRLIIASGNSQVIWNLIEKLGHKIQKPIPSLFTFNVPNFELEPLAGVSVQHTKMKLLGGKYEQEGPLLITHWGFSGPASLKLSAWEARYLADLNYETQLIIDWVPASSLNEITQSLIEFKSSNGKQKIESLKMNPIPKKLFRALCLKTGFSEIGRVQQLTDKNLQAIAALLKRDIYHVQGKTTNKEEFVTCGGITLNEVSFKTMESKFCPGLYFCGEVLDIDGVTGGFNFQAAWSTGWLAGNSASL